MPSTSRVDIGEMAAVARIVARVLAGDAAA